MPPLEEAWKNWLSSNSQASRGVGEEHRLDLGVLAADALQREEEELLGEPALRLVHAARDVEREDHRGVDRRRGALHQLAEAQVLVDDRRPASAWMARRLTASFRCGAGPGASARRACPSLRARSRARRGSRVRLGLRSGSLSSSQSQSTISSIFISTTKRISPLLGAARLRLARRPPRARAAARRRAGPCPARRPAASPGRQAEARVLQELHRHHHRAVARAGHQVAAGEELGQAVPSPPRAPSGYAAASRARPARRGRTTAFRRRCGCTRFIPARAAS